MKAGRKNRAARLVASFGGCGFAPRAPGTVGSLAALPVGYALLKAPALLPPAVAAATVGGLWATQRAGGGADHGWIVIDEVAGQWLTLLGFVALPGLPAPTGARRLWFTAGAFALFRLFDITKPGPIGRIDRRHDAWGVMGDDLAAGAAGAAVLLALRLLLEKRG